MTHILPKDKYKKVILTLEEMYPDAKAELHYKNPFELLIATILSAQCTDVQVNKTTATLFQEYTTPADYLTLTQDELGEKIHSCGFYQTKSKYILETCKILLEEYDSKVPDTMEDLTRLPGVGRKTANVVLSNAFGVPGIAVDTHVFRVSNRIGLADAKDVLTTEKQLMKHIPEDRWSKAHHTLIFHGRRCCRARNPKCKECRVIEECLFEDKNL